MLETEILYSSLLIAQNQKPLQQFVELKKSIRNSIAILYE